MTRPIWEQRIRDGGCSASVAETRDLLDEIDRLRALPVIATCGECGHRLPSFCDHPSLASLPKRRRDIDPSAAPPPWCPLREGGR